MKFTMGGRPLDLTREQVLSKMKGVAQESIREHLVEIDEGVYPPKQVLHVVTGWDRTSYTTMEAQRILAKLGFVCRRADRHVIGRPAWVPVEAGADAEQDVAGRVAALEAALATAQIAIAGLNVRLTLLEPSGG